MNKYEKETEKVLLDHEKKAYNDLKATYTNALKDIKLRIKSLQADIELLKMTEGDEDAKNRVQSKVYQLEYQKALEGQINAILEVVKQDNVKTTQTFLTKMYEDSYLAINYNLQKRGIPVIMPINNKLIVDVINMPTEDLKFSERLYTQVNHLKKTVKAEISRGIATGQSYGKIAQQVSLLTEADLNKSYRIVRTEGGRVSSEAKLQSMQEAKARGCDIVKQWDATLDNATRDVHQQLDGQWVEVDEYFKASGYKTKRPHGFGMASQDINCRCVLLSVPRWDLEDTVEKLDNITGEIITAKNYADWKQKYYSVVNDYKEEPKTDVKETKENNLINNIIKKYVPKETAIKMSNYDYEKLAQELREEGYLTEDLLKTRRWGYEGEDLATKKLLYAKNYNALPQVVDAETFDNLGDDYIKVFRAVNDNKNLTAKEINEQFRSGNLYIGNGLFGNGTYTAVNVEIAKGFGKDIMEIAIPKNARILDFEDIENELIRTADKLPSWKPINSKIYDFANEGVSYDFGMYDYSKAKFTREESNGLLELLNDTTFKAVACNYDIIKVPPKNWYAVLSGDAKSEVDKLGIEKEPYYVILNRGAVVVKRGD